MTLPGAAPVSTIPTKHHGQTHVLEVSIGIVGNGAVGGRVGGRGGRLRGKRGRERVRRARGDGSAYSRDGKLEFPALFNGDMSLRRMHGHTLP